MDEGAKVYKNGVNSKSVVRLVFLKMTGKLQLGYPINTQPKKTQIMTMLCVVFIYLIGIKRGMRRFGGRNARGILCNYT